MTQSLRNKNTCSYKLLGIPICHNIIIHCKRKNNANDYRERQCSKHRKNKPPEQRCNLPQWVKCRGLIPETTTFDYIKLYQNGFTIVKFDRSTHAYMINQFWFKVMHAFTCILHNVQLFTISECALYKGKSHIDLLYIWIIWQITHIKNGF